MPGDDLASSLTGPLLLCVCAAILLYGIFLAQTIFYWGTYTKDELRVKLWVVVLSLLETAHTIVCIHVLYYYFVAHYGEYAILEQIVWSSGVSIALEVSIVGLVQGFYVYRIWHITNKSKLITFALLFVITFCIVVGILSAALALKYDTWIELETSRLFSITGNCAWVLYVVGDAMITSTLVWHLYQGRRVGVGRRTKNMLKKLIHYSVTTGALTALTSLIVLICYNALPKNILFGGLLEVLSKLYANSSLAMLNARRRVSAGAMGTMTALSVPNPSNANNNNLSIRFGRGRRRGGGAGGGGGGGGGAGGAGGEMSAIRWAVASETKDMRTFGEETEAEAEVDTFGTAAAQDSADTFGTAAESADTDTFGTLALQETQKPVAAHLHEVDVEVGKGAV